MRLTAEYLLIPIPIPTHSKHKLQAHHHMYPPVLVLERHGVADKAQRREVSQRRERVDVLCVVMCGVVCVCVWCVLCVLREQAQRRELWQRGQRVNVLCVTCKTKP